jgi:peptide/nickel transport system substrate-binding protein
VLVLKRAMTMFFGASAALVSVHAAALAGKDTDTIVWASASEVDTTDLYYQNLREVVIMAHQMCDTLMHRDPLTAEYKPLLAESFKWVDDLTLEFTLRKGVKFHDGRDFGAADVAYTLNHAAAPDSGVVTRLVVDWIKNVEVVAPDKVRIHTKTPTPAAIDYLSGVTPIYPAGHYDKAPSVAASDGKTRRDWGAVRPVCTGPYKIKDAVAGGTVTLVRNEAYFKDGPKGQPKIGTIQFRTIADTETQVAELITGGIDWIWGVPTENAAQLGTVPNVTVKAAPTMRLSFLSLDAAGRSGDNPMKDVRVRQAIFHAIDREAIARDLVGEGAEVLRSMCYPTQFGCTTDVPQFAFDPKKAKALLAEAGYPNGFKIPFHAYRDRPYSEAVMNYLRNVGITGDMRFMQWKALRPVLQEGKAELAHISWGSQGIQDASASVSNYFKFSIDDYARDAEVKAWLEAADTTIDPGTRKDLYGKALKKIAENAYFVPIFSYGRTYAFNSALDYPVTPDELAHFYMARWK